MKRPIVMHFKKCGSSDTEQEEKQGFEDDDTVVMVRVLFACQTPKLKTHALDGSVVARCSALLTPQCCVPHSFGWITA